MIAVRALIAVLIVFFLAHPARAGEKLVLSSGMHEPWTNASATGFHNLFIAELFDRLGLKAEVTFNPAAARALQLADGGVDDGLAARMAGLEKDYPNLVRVPEPFFVNDFVAAGTTAPKIRKWADLAPFSISYILGWVVFDHNVPSVRELTTVKDSKQLFGLLKAARVEVILHERWQALWQAQEQGIDLKVAEPPLASAPMYIYLHKNHAALVPRVAAELAAMKANGRDKAIMQRAFARAGAAQ